MKYPRMLRVGFCLFIMVLLGSCVTVKRISKEDAEVTSQEKVDATQQEEVGELDQEEMVETPQQPVLSESPTDTQETDEKVAHLEQVELAQDIGEVDDESLGEATEKAKEYVHTSELESVKRYVGVTRANVRVSPSTKSEIITMLNLNDEVHLTQGEWLYVELPRKVKGFSKGWIHSSVVALNPMTATEKYVGVSRANVRSTPSRNSSIVARLGLNDPILVYLRTGEWLYIEFRGGQRGWIHTSLISERKKVEVLAVLRKTISQFEELPVIREYEFSQEDSYFVLHGKDSGKHVYMYEGEYGVIIETMLGKNSELIESYTILIPSDMPAGVVEVMRKFMANVTGNRGTVEEPLSFIRTSIDTESEASETFGDLRTQVSVDTRLGVATVSIFPLR